MMTNDYFDENNLDDLYNLSKILLSACRQLQESQNMTETISVNYDFINIYENMIDKDYDNKKNKSIKSFVFFIQSYLREASEDEEFFNNNIRLYGKNGTPDIQKIFR